jgi:cytochrome b561
MTDRLQYGNTAKLLHWLVVALLLVQYPLGWLMPDIHRGMKPGVGMTVHISFGILILLLIVFRFAWRLAHPVAPESSLPPGSGCHRRPYTGCSMRWCWPRP